MIEEAVPLVQDADLFVVVGTSLVVYPAAGLVTVVPPSAPKFILDTKIPATSGIANLVTIEKPATEGINDLKELLKQYLI